MTLVEQLARFLWEHDRNAFYAYAARPGGWRFYHYVRPTL